MRANLSTLAGLGDGKKYFDLKRCRINLDVREYGWIFKGFIDKIFFLFRNGKI
jgi:hypothetical protein